MSTLWRIRFASDMGGHTEGALVKMSELGALSGEIQARLQLDDSAWQDVTTLLATAAKELKVGQMVHAEDFNLFDSMSALELMDPKMDSGMLVNGVPPKAVAARLAANEVTLEFTSVRDVLATIDELFRCEAAWLNGLPLAQTLLSSIYLHKPSMQALVKKLTSVNDLVLNLTPPREALASLGNSSRDTLLLVMTSVCLSIMKTGNQIRDAVLRADIYEEEDFSPGNGFDLGVLDTLPVDTVESLLAIAEERLEAILAQQRAATSSKKASKKKNAKKSTTGAASNAESAAASSGGGDGDYELLYANGRVGAQLCEILIRRIQWRRLLLTTFTDMGLAEGPLQLSLWYSEFQKAQALLQSISTEQLEMDAECFSGKAIGFDSTISRMLLSGAPPRQVKIPTTEEALTIQQKFLTELLHICAPGELTSMEELRIFLSNFSRDRPTIVPRSYAVLFLYADKKIFSKYNFMDWLSASMVMNGVPSVLLSTQEGVLFSSRVIETLYESLKVYLHNRSRQRARIEYLFEEWAILQLEATVIDDKFSTEMSIPKAAYPRYFTAWSLEEVVLLMVQYIVLGLELDLYATSEYGTIYWYLDYLHGSRLQNLSVTWTFVERMKQMMPPGRRSHGSGESADHGHSHNSTSSPPSSSGADSAPSTTNSNKNAKRGKAKGKKNSAGTNASSEPSKEEQIASIDPTKARFLREIAYSEMERSLMRAYFQIFSALEREELIRTRPPTYGSAPIRFDHRFAAFRSIHFPAVLAFDDYSKNSDFSPFQVDLIYRSAEECFKVARGHAEVLLTDPEGINPVIGEGSEDKAPRRVRGEEVEALLRVCIANCANLTRHLQPATASATGSKGRKPGKGGADADSVQKKAVALRAVLDFSVHPHFPVIQFPEQKA